MFVAMTVSQAVSLTDQISLTVCLLVLQHLLLAGRQVGGANTAAGTNGLVQTNATI